LEPIFGNKSAQNWHLFNNSFKNYSIFVPPMKANNIDNGLQSLQKCSAQPMVAQLSQHLKGRFIYSIFHKY